MSMAAPASLMLATAAAGELARAEQLLEKHAVLLVAVNLLLLLLGLAIGLVLLARLRRHPVDWAERVETLSWRPWGLREVLVVVGALIAAGGWGDLLLPRLVAWGEGHGLRAGTVQLVGGSITFQGVALLVISVVLRGNRVSWSSAFGMGVRRLPGSIGQGAAFLLAALPPLMFYTLLYKVGLQASGVDVSLQAQVKEMAASATWPVRVYFVFLAAVLAPLVEELLFRGILFPVLLQRAPLSVALIAVSLLFALMHWHVPSLVPLFILSMAFCLAYLYAGSLWVCVAMHSLFNLSTVAVLFLLP